MSDNGKALSTERHSAEIADFLEKVKQAPATPRLGAAG